MLPAGAGCNQHPVPASSYQHSAQHDDGPNDGVGGTPRRSITGESILRVLILNLAWLLAVPLQAQGNPSAPRVIRGTVTQASTTNAVPYVSVIADGVLLGMAGQDGRFNVLVKHGDALMLNFRRIGFRPESLSIGSGIDTTMTITMQVAEQQLAGILIEEERIRSLETRGFYQRLADREKGLGSSQ